MMNRMYAVNMMNQQLRMMNQTSTPTNSENGDKWDLKPFDQLILILEVVFILCYSVRTVLKCKVYSESLNFYSFWKKICLSISQSKKEWVIYFPFQNQLFWDALNSLTENNVERGFPYNFYWANQWKADIKFVSWTQCEIRKERRDWLILACNDQSILSPNLNQETKIMSQINLSRTIYFSFHSVQQQMYIAIVWKNITWNVLLSLFYSKGSFQYFQTVTQNLVARQVIIEVASFTPLEYATT